MEPGGEDRQLAHLDGLRGLAAVIVVIHHYACAFLPAAVFGGAIAAHFSLERTIYSTPLQLIVAGNFAVCIFFTLSGFVLSHKFFITHNVGHARSGAAKRYFRLMPPIMSSILFSVAIYRFGWAQHLPAAHLSGSAIWLAQLWPQPAGIIEGLRQGLYGVLVGDSNTAVFNNVLWTMKIEFLGSFLVFAFLGLAGNGRNRWVAYLALTLLLWNTYYFAFILGLMLSDLSANQPEWRPHKATVITVGLTGLLLGAVPITGATSTIYSSLSIPFLPSADLFILPHVIGAAFVMIAVLYSRTLRVMLSIQPMRYLGKISFSMYLLHVLILGSLTSGLLIFFSHQLNYFYALLLSVSASVPIILVLSHYFTHFIDSPSVKYANKISSKWFAQKADFSDRITL